MGNSCCFFNDTATAEIYTRSLHDALPIAEAVQARDLPCDLLLAGARAGDTGRGLVGTLVAARLGNVAVVRSEEHTSELQSRHYLVCRLLLEKIHFTLFSRILSSSFFFCLV